MSFKIPILLIVFNRPEKTQIIFDIIKKIKPDEIEAIKKTFIDSKLIYLVIFWYIPSIKKIKRETDEDTIKKNK